MADEAVLKAIADMSTELTSMRTDLTSMRTDLTSMRTELTSTRTEITGRIDGLERAVAVKLADLGAELISTRTGIMGRVDRLQNVVEAVRDDVAVNFGRADHAASIDKGCARKCRRSPPRFRRWSARSCACGPRWTNCAEGTRNPDGHVRRRLSASTPPAGAPGWRAGWRSWPGWLPPARRGPAPAPAPPAASRHRPRRSSG